MEQLPYMREAWKGKILSSWKSENRDFQNWCFCLITQGVEATHFAMIPCGSCKYKSIFKVIFPRVFCCSLFYRQILRVCLVNSVATSYSSLGCKHNSKNDSTPKSQANIMSSGKYFAFCIPGVFLYYHPCLAFHFFPTPRISRSLG